MPRSGGRKTATFKKIPLICFVGVDAHIDPNKRYCCLWADVGIGPYEFFDEVFLC